MFFNITAALKKHLQDNFSVKSDADDGECRKVTLKAMLDGKLDDEKLTELTADPDADELTKTLTKLSTGVDALVTKIAGSGSLKVEGAAPPSDKAMTVDGALLSKMFAGSDGGVGDRTDPEKMFIRVKMAKETYSSERRKAFFPETIRANTRHPYAGQQAFINTEAGDKFIDHPSELQKAQMGAWIKHRLSKTPNLPGRMRMTDHDRDLVMDMLHNTDFVGTWEADESGGGGKELNPKGQRLKAEWIKAVIDDSTSGGQYIEPIFFDEMVILKPVLYGEFLPKVNLVPIPRGRVIQGGSISLQTLSGGGFDATNIPLFTTTSFISAFNTTIYVCNGAIQVGLDFLSDSPVDVAGILTEQYGRVLLNFLDVSIATGDGTTRPTGIITTGGVNVAQGGAAATVGLYESFFFGVVKKYKTGYPTDRIIFGSNETTYQRARAIPVSGSDARRIFGMTHGDYMLMGHPYGISDSMTNAQGFFGNMARYRLYRRLGQTVNVTTVGQTLVLGNLMLLTARSRWGGQIEDTAAFSTSSSLQA